MSNTLDFAIATAQRAGDLLMEIHATKPRSIETKSSSYDLVTEADTAAEDLILSAIRERFPEHGILAEESAHALPTEEFYWAVDPLDGTTNFAHGLPIFCVSIALWRHAEPILGVIYDPTREELFWSEKGKGAWVDDVRLQTSQTLELKRSLLATGFPYDRTAESDNNLREFNYFTLRTQGIRRTGAAALDLAYVACGRLDGFWELGLEIWDWAAAMLLITEAGGRVTDERGQPWRRDGHILVTSNGQPALHEAMLRGIAQARADLTRDT